MKRWATYTAPVILLALLVGGIFWLPATVQADASEGIVQYAVAEGVYTFDVSSGEILDFKPVNDTEPFTLVIPEEIMGVPVTRVTGRMGQYTKGAFQNCANLEEVVLPDSVERIGYLTFYKSGLKRIILPQNVTYISGLAFSGSKLEYIEIHGPVALLMGTFVECHNLKTVKFYSDAPIFPDHEGNYPFGPSGTKDENMNVTCYYPANNSTWTEYMLQDWGANLTWIPQYVVFGDFDGSGMVTDADAVYLLRYTLFPKEFPISGKADVNNDGSVTDADAVYLLRHTLFPEEFPLGS